MPSEDELGVAETWLDSTLRMAPELQDTVAGRVFDSPPPAGTLYPYIIFNMQSADDVRGVGIARILSDTIYTVKAVAGVEEMSGLAEVAAAIDSALTLGQPEVVGTIGTMHSCVRERPVRYKEFTEGKYIAHRGGEYRLLVQMT